MDITLKNIDKVNAELTAVIEPADYEEKVEKAVKEHCKKLRMPGFRPGMVPRSLVKKQFGTGILAEELNKILQNAMYAYITDNNVNMLGEPISSEENNSIDLVEGGTFTFKFDLALAPEIDVTLTDKDCIDYYTITVDDSVIDKQVEMYRKRGGRYEQVEDYQEGDMLKGTFTQLDDNGAAVEGGLTATAAVMLPNYMKDEAQKAKFTGVKKGDVVTFNPSVAYNNSESELSSLLMIKKEEVANYKGDFNYEITEITRYMPGPVDEALFESVYPGKGISTESDFRSKIREDCEAQYAKDCDYKFLLDVRKYLTEKAGKLEFPEEKLRAMMLKNAGGDQEKVDKNFEKSIEELTWHLMKEQLVKNYEIKIEDDDVTEMAKEVTRMQFAQYGMLNIPDEYIENSVQEMLKKRETVDNLIDRAIELKLGAKIKKTVTLKMSSVMPEEFNKLF